MKNLMVANAREDKRRYNSDNLSTLLKIQVENSLDLGWKKEDLIILSNFNFKFLGVKSIKTKLNDFCFTGSKGFAVKWYYENINDFDVVWAKDLDCWQNVEFECPEFKDVGIAQYSNSKLNGGSVFWKYSGKDILDNIVNTLVHDEAKREEPVLNKILKSEEYKNRVTILNNTFNCGCSGFCVRYAKSIKPVHVLHFHPYNRCAWETHVLDRNGLGEIAVSRRLERVIRKYYTNLPIKLKGDRYGGEKQSSKKGK